MLRRPQVHPFVHRSPDEGGTLQVQFLRDPGDGRVTTFLARLLRLLHRLEGAPLRTVQEALRRQERRVRDARRLSGLARTLLGVCRFDAPPGAAQAPEFRDALFQARGRHWPPVPGDEEIPYLEAAAALGLAATGAAARRLVYADHPGERILARAPRMDAAALLDRYNLELARGVLLDAESVTIRARGGWKDLLRAVKLARLMYRLHPEDAPGARRRRYRLELTGPASPFLAHPRRYGARFASIVPALTRAPSWSLDARVRWEGGVATYRLDHTAPLGKSRRARYDSRWEAELARGLRGAMASSGPEGGGRIGKSDWSLHREETLVPVGDSVVLPDFTLRHRDGREALVELVGFWTPEYLADKLRKVQAAGLPNLVLVVFRGLAAGEGEAAVEAAGAAEVVWFSRKARAREVLEAAERVAV